MDKTTLDSAIEEMLYGFQLIKQSDLEADRGDENSPLTYSDGWRSMENAEKRLSKYIKSEKIEEQVVFKVFDHNSQQFIAMNNSVEPAVVFKVNKSNNFIYFDALLLPKLLKLARDQFPNAKMEVIPGFILTEDV